MVQQLENYQQQFEQIKEDAKELISGLNSYGFHWHPSPRAWSIAENLDHLVVIGNLLLPRIDEAIRTAKEQNLRGEGPFRFGVRGALFVRSMEPPVRWKVRTQSVYVPSTARKTDDVQREFFELQDRLIERVRSADGLDLSKMMIRSPAYQWLQFNAAVWFASTAAHERRHLWQARKVRTRPLFPANRP
jgi:hypothetical protein